jgi:hypothetical protein
MQNCRLVVRSALIATFLLALVMAYPVLSTQGFLSTQGVVYAQEVTPADEEPEPQPEEPPAFDFTKLVNNQEASSLETAVEVEVGANLTFRYEVVNTGNVTLTWSTLTDDVLGDLTGECGLPREVGIGAVEVCDVNRDATDAPGGLQNIGTATIIDLDPQQDVAWYRTPEIDEPAPDPTPTSEPQPDPEASYTFTKYVNNQDANNFETSVLVPIGSELVFRYELINTGEVPLEWTNLTDDVFGDLTDECSLPMTIPPAQDVAVVSEAACEITRPAGDYPDGRQNIGTAIVTDLDPQQDVAWYRTPDTMLPEPETPPVPIPEPITIVLFGTGLAALSAAAASRRRQE